MGVDLAAQPQSTFAATVTWTDDVAEVTALIGGVDDEQLRSIVDDRTGVVGIDCPFGWPESFVRMVSAHHAGELDAWPSGTPSWRRVLTLRATDRYVQRVLGLTPLSVSADRIAHPALRLAAVLSQTRATVLRDGSDGVAEVYPAAALKRWGLPYRSYKRAANQIARSELVTTVLASCPWLDLGPFEQLVRDSDDALDSVICALVARCVSKGMTDAPPDPSLARLEGWIHLPGAGSLQALVS